MSVCFSDSTLLTVKLYSVLLIVHNWLNKHWLTELTDWLTDWLLAWLIDWLINCCAYKFIRILPDIFFGYMTHLQMNLLNTLGSNKTHSCKVFLSFLSEPLVWESISDRLNARCEGRRLSDRTATMLQFRKIQSTSSSLFTPQSLTPGLVLIRQWLIRCITHTLDINFPGLSIVDVTSQPGWRHAYCGPVLSMRLRSLNTKLWFMA